MALSCRVLGVSRAGYYAWRDRPPSARARADAELTAVIHRLHRESRGTYGSPRIHADLRAARAAARAQAGGRLMRQAGLAGLPPAPAAPPHDGRRPGGGPAPNLVQRASTGWRRTGSGWRTSPTCPTEEGWLYLAVVLDAFSRRVVGWAMADHLRTELVLDALDDGPGDPPAGGGLVHIRTAGANTLAGLRAAPARRPGWCPR